MNEVNGYLKCPNCLVFYPDSINKKSIREKEMCQRCLAVKEINEIKEVKNGKR